MHRRTAPVLPAIAVVLAATMVVLSSVRPPATGAQAPPTFATGFETPADFYDQFDFGYSGVNPWDVPDGSVLREFHGDHDEACGPPTTSRRVAFAGDADALDYSQLFWHCAPGGDPAKGHLMTGVDTLGYNVAWFSPKPTFTAVEQVCWDVNETELSSRKWTQVLFVGTDDAFRYPAGSATAAGPTAARGSGGFDLGYTAPDFRADPGPNTGIFPQGGTLAGFKSLLGGAHWFQDQDTFTTDPSGASPQILGITDKAERFRHCLANQPGNRVRLTQETPTGTREVDMVGQIPSGAVRVVFQDDNYDPPKADNYDETAVTWHWDNIEITAASAAVVDPPPEAVARQRSAEAGAGDATSGPGESGQGGAGVEPPGDSDEVSFGSLATKLGDVDGGGGIGIVALVTVVLVVGAVVLVAARRARRTGTASGDAHVDDPPGGPAQP